PKTIQVLGRARARLRKASVPILKISDRNTTGLRGSDKQHEGDWVRLVKASGVSLKGAGKGGCYGIGTNVFWLNSQLRTIYFATDDEDGKWAFQGVSKLVSHPLRSGKLTRAVGFFGETDGFAPIRHKTKIP